MPIGTARLAAGAHRLTLRYEEGGLGPGGAGSPFPIGPLALSQANERPMVDLVNPRDARSLCGQRLDWVEALGP